MFMMKSLSLMTMFLSLNAFSSTFDIVQDLNGVSLKSAKEEAIRSYMGSKHKVLPYPIQLVLKGVTNFTERCNNTFKEMRKFTPENVDCKYHNENLVETFIVKDIRQMDYFKDVSEAYLLGRQVYNRSSYGYYELVTVREALNDKKQKTFTVTLRMLDDKEVKVYTNPKFKRESAFDQSTATFTMTEISQSETQLTYEFAATTDHWLLNKEVSVPQVFASISKSINDLIKTVEEESSFQKRQLASGE
jgi:hypothetical protein